MREEGDVLFETKTTFFALQNNVHAGLSQHTQHHKSLIKANLTKTLKALETYKLL